MFDIQNYANRLRFPQMLLAIVWNNSDLFEKLDKYRKNYSEAGLLLVRSLYLLAGVFISIATPVIFALTYDRNNISTYILYSIPTYIMIALTARVSWRFGSDLT